MSNTPTTIIPNSVYGLQSAKGLMANLEANWTVSENFTANLFYTYEEQRAQSAGISYGSNSNTASVNGSTVVSGGCFNTVLAKNMNAKVDPCLNWSTDMKDKVNTIGAGFDWKNLASGKLEVMGNVLYSDARTDIGVAGGSYVNNPYAVAGKPPVDPAVGVHTRGQPADGQPEVDRAADRGAVRARQAVGDPRVLLVAEAQGDGLRL